MELSPKTKRKRSLIEQGNFDKLKFKSGDENTG